MNHHYATKVHCLPTRLAKDKKEICCITVSLKLSRFRLLANQ
ncbi:hypothetical protein [Vibrio porteresiae]|uniref:Uncharacterized protein n=1 Tax=Vibrio porteresiae DSM 19223 TaxID=1123496 RepID=A0ABZ0QJY7_9VIBR|nr:hypothetical protein [Vibrio porteresiae]WPC76826.1 hypothetical protein R8Z52_20070 [Vibrio porteresiae DSM 19223]